MKTTIIYSALYAQSDILSTHTIAAAATVKTIYKFNKNVVIRVFSLSQWQLQNISRASVTIYFFLFSSLNILFMKQLQFT